MELLERVSDMQTPWRKGRSRVQWKWFHGPHRSVRTNKASKRGRFVDKIAASFELDIHHNWPKHVRQFPEVPVLQVKRRPNAKVKVSRVVN